MLPKLSPRLLKTASPLSLRTHTSLSQHRSHHRLASASASASVSALASASVHRPRPSISHLPISIAPFHTHNKRTTSALPRPAQLATPTPHRLSTPSLASYIRAASTHASAAEQSISRDSNHGFISPPAFSPNPSPIMTITPPEFPPPPPIPQADGPVKLKLPPTEDRPHRYLVLPNGLEVIIVSDPKADKAAASMDVGVGHLSDPDNLAGCAHFCEHLMFMGTKKYPSENEYSSYLNAHNGHSNAWTAMTSTNYYFDVAPDALEGALDRFSGFFYEPLFSEDCTEREIKAVNSEHKKNIQGDLWRFFQLEKSLSKPGHVYGKFGTGNLETLWEQPRADGRDPRQQLIEWWEKEYCARRMKLAVAGREDLDTLEKWVRERFDKVPVRTEGRPLTGPEGVYVSFPDHPFGSEQRGVVNFIKPVREVRALEISLPTPDLNQYKGTKPLNFLAHFIGHEGRGSLLSYLKKKGWVNLLRAGPSHEVPGFGFFKINIELTPDGLAHWRDVAMVVFKYMTLLRTTEPSQIAFEEMAKIADISYTFAERGRVRDYVTRLSGYMQDPYPRDEIVSAQWLLGEWDPEIIRKTCQLLDPTQAMITVVSQELPKDVSFTFDKSEKIYGTEYHQERLSQEFLEEAKMGKPIPELFLPGPNEFIPENLDVNKVEVDEPAIRPELLRDTEISRLWYKQDDRFFLPRSVVYVELFSPLLNVTPRNAVMARLLADLFTDSNNEDTYDAELADLSFGMYYQADSFTIAISGFTDKLPLLLEKMVTKFLKFELDPERFRRIVDRNMLMWRNFALSDPYHVAHFYHSYVMTPNVWTHEERIEEAEHITLEDVKAFGHEVFRRMYFETLVHGSLDAAGAKKIQDMLERIIQPRALAPAEKRRYRELLLPPNSEHIWARPVKNPVETNSCVVYWVYACDKTDPVSRMKVALFSQIASEPAFNVLRTKEQLGYIVSLAGTPMGIRVLVQSEKTPAYVEGRIESFLTGFRETLENLSDAEFDRHRQALIDKKLEQPKHLSGETRRFWRHMVSRDYEFGKQQTDIDTLRKLTKADVLAMYDEAVSPASDTRRKLSMHLKSQVAPSAQFDISTLPQVIVQFTHAGIVADEDEVRALIESKPDLEAVRKFGHSLIERNAATEENKAKLRTFLDELKGVPEPDDSAALKKSNVFIDDVNTFKSQLDLNKAQLPLEPLCPSKM